MGQDNLDKNNISKIELSLDNVKAVSKGMPGGFFIYKADEGEELIAWNDMVLTIFGCADDVEFKALAGNSFRGMVHRDDYALVDKSIIEQVASDTHKFDHVEYRIIKKNGEEAWVDDFGRLVDTTEFGLVYFVFIRDVTEQKRIQAENLRIHLELEKEKQIKNAIDEFLFNVSHDIRTPMNAITGYTELALHSIDDRAELTGCLEKIKISGGHMMSLIDDLLEMSELSSGNIELHTGPCSISKEMKTATEMLKERADEKNIMLSQLHYYL
ncbi:MAG: PAS domain-containing sensor histidine kinase [Butyrivibrio sp.]|nr:PAS domain-containing sensor histidine kinase [Butyrivibrio sp.]